jgi:hypothetical protein
MTSSISRKRTIKIDRKKSAQKRFEIIVNKTSRLNKSRKTNNRKRQKSTTRSILSVIDLAKIFKKFDKKRSFHQKMNVLCDVLQTMKKTIVDFNTSQRKSKQMFKIKNATSAFLRFIHSSKIFKFDAKRLIKLCKDNTKLTSFIDTHRLIKEDNLSRSSISSTNKKAMQQFAKASLRRSTRISK